MHRRQRKLKTEQLAKVSNLVASGVEACQPEAVGKSMHTLALVVIILIMCTLYFLLFSLL